MDLMSNAELQEILEAKQAEIARYEAELQKRGEKRSRARAEAESEAADDEKPVEPARKKQKKDHQKVWARTDAGRVMRKDTTGYTDVVVRAPKNAFARLPSVTDRKLEAVPEPVVKTETDQKEAEPENDTVSEFGEYEDADSEPEVEETFAMDTFVAVAYGNVNGLSRRRWYAAKVVSYNAEDQLYTVVWKFPPKKTIGGKKVKKTTFECSADKVRVITEDDYNTAPNKGTGYVGLHRASTFVAQPEDEASDAESEDEGVQKGDHVAVAYGAARANAKGTDPTAGRDPAKFHKRFLWYAATVTERNDNDIVVQWACPFSKKKADLFFQTTTDKVQPITKKEFRKAKKAHKAARKKKTYGLVGIHRMATKEGLTSGN